MNSKAKSKPTYPAWAPRFWHGMLVSDWLKLLAHNRFRIHPTRLGLACTVTSLTLFNSTMRLFHQAVFSRRVTDAEIPDDPVFIVVPPTCTNCCHAMIVLRHRQLTSASQLTIFS
jgi:hypothetical protein